MSLINRQTRAFAALLLASLFGCQPEPEEMKISGERQSRAARAVFRDTLSYHDGLNNLFGAAVPGDSLGVWFSPRSDSGRLVAVEYFFGDTIFSSTDSLWSFVWQAPRYAQAGGALQSAGAEVLRFRFAPDSSSSARTSVVFEDSAQAMPINPCSEFFIGWVADTFAVARADSLASHLPRRSYIIRANDSTRALTPLPFDLAVRAIFEYPHALADTGKMTFELRWDKKDADLDLYFIAPAFADSVSWQHRSGKRTRGKLDVDDNDGYGPEKITYSFYPRASDTLSLAHLGVHYYGPKSGKATRASVLVYRNGELCQTLGPCRLQKYDWWEVARMDLQRGVLLADSCRINPNVNVPRKVFPAPRR